LIDRAIRKLMKPFAIQSAALPGRQMAPGLDVGLNGDNVPPAPTRKLHRRKTCLHCFCTMAAWGRVAAIHARGEPTPPIRTHFSALSARHRDRMGEVIEITSSRPFGLRPYSRERSPIFEAASESDSSGRTHISPKTPFHYRRNRREP